MTEIITWAAVEAAAFLIGWIVGKSGKETEGLLMLPAQTTKGRMRACMEAMGIKPTARMDEKEEVWVV